MKITFWGTSHGVPAHDRYCSCILLESGDSFYFIDAGAPAIDLIHRNHLDINKFRALFTTHAHSDHTFGIPALAELMNWYYKSSSADFYMTEQPLADAIMALMYASDTRHPVDTERLRFKIASTGAVYEDENIKVEYFQTGHMSNAHPSYSILVSEGEKKVLFSGDLSICLSRKDIPSVVFEDGVDAMVCEMAHFSLKDLTPYLERLKVKELYFNHIYPIEKYDQIEAVKNNYSFAIYTPKDNDSYEI